MKRFYKKTQVIIKHIIEVLNEIDGSASTRQVYYQLVGRGVISANDKGYDKVQRLLVDLRRQDMISSKKICDRTRNKYQAPSWEGLSDILESCKIQYRKDYWAEQDNVVYIAVEKQALEGVFSSVVDSYGVGLFVLRGYPSYALLYDWAQEIIEFNKMNKEVNIYYFGDFDASGMQIDESVANQIFEFGAKFNFKRVGATSSDLQKNYKMSVPVKITDSRAKGFISKYGNRCLELDAIPPNELKQRIEGVIIDNINFTNWGRMQEIEKQEKLTLDSIISNIY